MDWVSVISQIGFLTFQGLSEQDRQLFKTFCRRINIVDLHSNHSLLIDNILHFRICYKLKLPDAIIAASALQNNAILITEDTDFKKISELRIISINL